jgi:hypothetical protein
MSGVRSWISDERRSKRRVRDSLKVFSGAEVLMK